MCTEMYTIGDEMSGSLAFKARGTNQICPKCGAPLWETFDEDGEVDGYHCYRLSGELHSFTVKQLKALGKKAK